jgi:hypothetical protein
MSEKIKLRMAVSIAGTIPGDRNFSAQPGDVVAVDSSTAKKWIAGGLATRAAENEQLNSENDLLFDLSATEALRRICSSCEKRRGAYVLKNRALCPACFRAELEV